MMFKSKTVDLSKLKEEDPNTYSALITEAIATVEFDENEELLAVKNELAQYKDKEGRIKINSLISDYGEKLKVPEVAKEGIEGGLNFEDALLKMVDSHIKNVKDIEESFENTAPVAVGEDLEEGNQDEPKDFHEAMNIIVERDNCSKQEAAVKVQKEFPKLLAEKYENRTPEGKK